MSDQPTFRPRVLPMPKVGDILVAPTLRGNEVCVVEHVETDLFVTSYGTFRLDWKQDWYPRWNWQDTAVEALRLQEAAWRADTSELPEWIEGAIRFCKADNMELTLENLAWCAVQGNCENMEQATRFLVNELPCLLRWQAQQEQK